MKGLGRAAGACVAALALQAPARDMHRPSIVLLMADDLLFDLVRDRGEERTVTADPARSAAMKRTLRDRVELCRASQMGEDYDMDATITAVRFSEARGLGAEPGVMRRDPSDIIRVRGLYYVWYTKGAFAHGYDATIWYATSPDGHAWTERGEALPRGGAGRWDEGSVFTPSILEAEGRYYLFYTAVPKPFIREATRTAIGVAVADAPDGPWQRREAPVVVPADDPARFDSMRVDDACMLKRDGRYWLYFKGRQLNNTWEHTKMGVSIADRPEGPYVKHPDCPVVGGGHEVLVWPMGRGVMAIINIGPEGIARTLQYAEDGVHFTRCGDAQQVPHAGGAWRPEAFTDSGQGRMIEWGLHIGNREGCLPFLERFDVEGER